MKLKGFQKKFLRGTAHSLNPVVIIGQKGFTDTVAKALDSALSVHELIKVKFVDLKEKGDKEQILSEMENKSGCEQVGMIGHVAILYRDKTPTRKNAR